MFGIKKLNLKQPDNLKKKLIELEVGGWIGERFGARGWAGTTLVFPFFNVILYYVCAKWPTVSPYVRVHEICGHIRQDERNANCFVTYWNYAFEMLKQRIKHGSWFMAYKANKYEKDAYRIEQEAWDARPGIPDWCSWAKED